MVEIDKIIKDALLKYPGGAAKESEVREMMEEIISNREEDFEVLNNDEVLEEIRGNWKELSNYEKDIEEGRVNFFSIGPTKDEEGFKIYCLTYLYKALITEYRKAEPEPEVKKRGRPQTDLGAYSFDNLFTSIEARNRLLNAAVHVGLIERTDTGNGYRWIEVEGEKGHRVRAFWQVAFESGLIKKGRTNEVKIADSIRVFFGIEKIEEKVLKRENIYHKTYKKNFTALKNEIDKLLKNK